MAIETRSGNELFCMNMEKENYIPAVNVRVLTPPVLAMHSEQVFSLHMRGDMLLLMHARWCSNRIVCG
jgi:hypothetical protein